MELIHSFDVSQDVRDPMEISSTNTRDVIVAGQYGMAMFSGDGICKKKKTLEKDSNGRGVAMDPQGNILITGNIRSSIKCKECDGVMSKLKVVRFLQYDFEEEGTTYFLTTKCSSGRHATNSLSQVDFDRAAICAVQPSKDFTTVVCDLGNKCLYIFKHDKIVHIIGNTLGAGKMCCFQYPHILASLSNGDIVVGDYLAKRIKIFSNDGTFRNEFGENVSGGIFPHGVAVDSKDRIIVADKDNHRVLMFDTIGFLRSILISDTIEDDMDIRPIAVAVKKSVNGDRLYVLLKGLPGTNFAQIRIYVLHATGELGRGSNPNSKITPGHTNDGDAPPSYAPPSYEEVTSGISKASLNDGYGKK